MYDTGMAKAKRKVKQARAPRGQVGVQTYEQVRKVVAEKNVPLVKAFEEVAAATQRKPSTIAVTYYRIARKMGGATRKKRARKTRSGSTGNGRRTRGRPAKTSGAQGALSRAAASIKELENLITRQEREIARLKGEAGLADRIRKAFRE